VYNNIIIVFPAAIPPYIVGYVRLQSTRHVTSVFDRRRIDDRSRLTGKKLNFPRTLIQSLAGLRAGQLQSVRINNVTRAQRPSSN